MKLTRAHAEYWRQRKTPMPQWAREFAPAHRVDIDGLINAHADIPRRDAEHAAGNLLSLIAMKQRNYARLAGGADAEYRTHLLCLYLEGIAARAGSGIPGDTPRRQSYAAKWARRLRRASLDRIAAQCIAHRSGTP